MSKAIPSHLMLTWKSAKSDEHAELDNISTNHSKFGNSTSKIEDRLIYFYACCIFYYKCKFQSSAEWRIAENSKVTKIKNVLNGD